MTEYAHSQQREHRPTCRGCGYRLGIDPAEHDSVCPECGIGHALDRGGTPWQRATGLVPLLRSDIMALRNPLRLYRGAKFNTDPHRDPASPFSLLIVLNSVLGASILSAALLSVWVLDAIAGAVRDPARAETWIIIGQLFVVMVATQVGFLLIAAGLKQIIIEQVAGVLGARIQPAVTMTIGAHSSAGFVVGTLLFAVVAQLAAPVRAWLLPLVHLDQFSVVRSAVEYAPLAALLFGVVLGWRAVSAGLKAAIESGAVRLPRA